MTEFWSTHFGSNFSSVVVENACKSREPSIDIDAACRVHFDPTDDTVNAYGNITRGRFEANPGITGVGVRERCIVTFLIGTVS
jgi:hypothetical protein